MKNPAGKVSTDEPIPLDRTQMQLCIFVPERDDEVDERGGPLVTAQIKRVDFGTRITAAREKKAKYRKNLLCLCLGKTADKDLTNRRCGGTRKVSFLHTCVTAQTQDVLT